MSRTLVVCLIAWVITRLFFWASGFYPVRDLGGVLGYALDFGIWMTVSWLAYWALGAGRFRDRKEGQRISVVPIRQSFNR